ncbi:MAG: nuclear transport factor 2 family protein [Planctomycetes bacterium]|nr:nuclear transport factor 2 family protein [Planctomycetota bacterium]
MRVIAASLLLLLGACSKEGPMPLDIAQNKQMIWEVIKAYHDASDKGDLDVIQTLLSPDVSMIMGADDVVRGKDAVLRALRDKLKAYDGQSRSTITGKEVIKPDGNIALVTYVASVGTQRGIITAICSRNKDNKWLIAHIHDTWSMPSQKK